MYVLKEEYDAQFKDYEILCYSQGIIMKIDTGGAYLSTTIDCDMVMELDHDLSRLVIMHMPELKEYIARNGKLYVVLEKALHAKLWYEV